MNYTIFIGILDNLNTTWQNWIFLFIFFEIIIVSFVIYLALNKHGFKKNDSANKNKIIFLMITFLIILILFGIVGFITFLVTYLITTSFLSDYRVGE